ncbi:MULTISPECIES: hypothetical protein [Streptomyces]|uniref:Uncharacterized protein n=1 Tax=Streptomyces venezuelae (strain ATCC 10712 / CBS 650.69 / DSM 40230 / JCM 4526 / NBRC 13096 / PD 04745) TaxID=953739 RepID=F2R3C4_STRVP|nr:hypothetical protein [Streptomyces venezuelae]APE21699.1 hypothetical protein vnz_12155 [Streptomyces venezuelae]CCA55766.1 hypothetical protein SVEN_2480 [Streptomyces venezuelae ATCC 10712]
MTDISTKPVTLPSTPLSAAPLTPAATSPAASSAVQEAPVVEHTAGGWPVVPLATTGANSAVSGLAAAALAGGPAGIATAVAGLAVVGGTVLARRAVRNRSARTTARAGTTTMPTPRTARQNTSGTRSASGMGAKRGGSGSPSRSGKPSLGKGRSSGSTASGASSARTGRPSGRLGQVKALRQAASISAPTRAERRAQTTAARRLAADTRRNTPSTRLTSGGIGDRAGRDSGRPGPKGRGAGAGLGGRVRAGRDAAVQRARAVRDRQAAKAVEASRGKVRAAATAKQARAAKRAVRKEARRQLWRSALRKQGRRLAAALLAAPVGALGMLTTPLGRKLGIAALQHPGRRLYRRLMRTAEEQQAVRDAAIRERRQAAEAAIDAELADAAPQIGGTAERPFHLTPASPTAPVEVVNVSGFKFEEAAAEMENAARTYEPDNAMEILAMVENLPDALTSVANTFRILAERSDSEFPLEKDIAAAFDEIYGALMRAVDSSGDLGPLFQQVHEHDIARHTDPRNGPEAEKGWNV